MDTDTLVIFGALEVVRVCTGKAAIARVLTGLGALMRVPEVSGRVVSNDVIKSLAVFIIINKDSIDSRADCLIVFLDKALLSAGIVHDEHLVRFIMTSGLQCLGIFVCLKANNKLDF